MLYLSFLMVFKIILSFQKTYCCREINVSKPRKQDSHAGNLSDSIIPRSCFGGVKPATQKTRNEKRPEVSDFTIRGFMGKKRQ